MKEIIENVKNELGNNFPLLTAFLYLLLRRERRGFNPSSARYCYSVWLRHLVLVHKNSLSTKLDIVAEFGPGDTFGVGLAALLSGVNKYYALDVATHINTQKNIEFLDELVELFQKRENIPDQSEFPEVRPYLDSYTFPKYILTDKLLRETLQPKRIESIRQNLLHPKSRNKKTHIEYFVPWNNIKVLKENSLDLIFSQAVLEYVDNLYDTFDTMYRWLKPAGIMSHTIDFRSHGTSRIWNGHWGRSDFIWNLMNGKINRQPHSVYLKLFKKYGFKIVCDLIDKDIFGIKRKQLASRFRNISESDLTTSGTFIIAVKK